MSIDKFPVAANDNFSEENIDEWLEGVRKIIEQGETHAEAQRELADVIAQTETYLKRKDATVTRVRVFEALIHTSLQKVLDTAPVMPPGTVEEVARIDFAIQLFLESHEGF